MLRTALVLLAVLALAVGALWLGQRKLIYLPDGGSPMPAPPAPTCWNTRGRGRTG